jgi:ABC-type nitrate/sulfonate/bicarbonate transport system substrate-binding protein
VTRLRGCWKAAALAACLLAPGCRGTPPPPEKLVIANARMPQTSLVHVAAARGYFAEEGLDVTIRSFDFGRLALESLLAGEADLATAAETPVVLSTLRGARIALLATISNSTRNNAVLGRKAAAIGSPRDLAGKRVGVTRGTTGEFFLEMTLVRSGVLRSKVTFVDLKPDEMEAALRRGEVDAVATWIPYVTLLETRLGGQLVALESESPETFALVARREFPRERGPAAERALRALLRAERFARERPQEARGIVAEALRVPSAELSKMWDVYDLRVRLDQGLFVLMDEQARWAIRSGLAPRQVMPDFREVIASAPLLAVKADAVHLIR